MLIRKNTKDNGKEKEEIEEESNEKKKRWERRVRFSHTMCYYLDQGKKQNPIA